MDRSSSSCSSGHGEAAARITWCIAERGVLTGEVGVGKTVAVRAAIAGLDATESPDPPRRFSRLRG
jgi:type II secretory pathway predicted ATPase ExeA